MYPCVAICSKNGRPMAYLCHQNPRLLESWTPRTPPQNQCCGSWGTNTHYMYANIHCEHFTFFKAPFSHLKAYQNTFSSLIVFVVFPHGQNNTYHIFPRSLSISLSVFYFFFNALTSQELATESQSLSYHPDITQTHL